MVASNVSFAERALVLLFLLCWAGCFSAADGELIQVDKSAESKWHTK